MDNMPHHAFSMRLSQIANRIPSEVILMGDDGTPFNGRAVWDTGAMKSVVTPKVAEALHQSHVDFVTVTGINNVSKVPVIVLSVILPNRIKIANLKTAVCDMRQGIDMLIGMDIIGMGDFFICNADNKTLFSYAVPPLPDKIDLVDRAEAANRKRTL
jgi:hypothetical protein